MNREKYSRQILFPPIGADGQEKLLESKAVILGCGALGTAQANALARAGVGTLRIVDRDFVEESTSSARSSTTRRTLGSACRKPSPRRAS